MRRAIVAATLAASVVLGVAAQAAAAQEYAVEGTHRNAIGQSITQASHARTYHSDATTVTIQLDCGATTTPAAIATGIQQCYLLGANGTKYHASSSGAVPGPAAVAYGVFAGIPRQHYRVCVQANAYWRENQVTFTAPLICSR